MTLLTKPALVAALLTAAASAGALADTGRPSDYVAPVLPAVVDRPADDAFARYQRIVDGPSRIAFEKHAHAIDQSSIDSYATYLLVVDGMGRDAAIERASLRQASMAQAEQRRLARAGR